MTRAEAAAMADPNRLAVNHRQGRRSSSVIARRDYDGDSKGTGVAAVDGELVAALDASHGWFWWNRTRNAVFLTLETEDQELKEIK